MKTKLIFLSLLLLAFATQAQNITGPNPVNVGDQLQYTFNGGAIYMTDNWIVQGVSATIVTKSRVGSTYYATIEWLAPGAGTIEFRDQTYTLRGSLAVTVNVATPNTSFTIVQSCGSTSVTRDTNPPSGINWYWQTSDTGTSTTWGFASSINRSSSGLLFLRARLGTSGAWSASAQPVGTISVVSATAVPASSTDGNVISDVTTAVPLTVSTVSGATSYRWFTQPSGGTVISGATSNTYSPSLSPSSSQAYYVEAVTGNCASTTRRPVTGYVHPKPVISASNGGDVSYSGNVSLSVSNYTYSSYQWIRNGVDIAGQTSSTYVTSSLGTYQVRVTKGNSTAVLSAGSGTSVYSQNYIIAQSIQRSGVTDEASIDTLAVTSMMQTAKYMDGLGRPIQTVTRKGSPLKYDVVQVNDYDPLGREPFKYLPYVASTNDGRYKPDAVGTPSATLGGAVNYAGSPHSQYYNNGTTDKVVDDTKPFAETRFASDPLSRPLEQGSPGIDWQPDATNAYTSSDRTVKFSYETNAGSEVRVFIYTAPTPSTTLKLSPAGYYASGQLLKTKTKDEQFNEVVEFKDQSGKVVLKKVQAPNSTWAETYYIYDDAGNLVVVLPPEATKAFAN